jgi:hypothetical protein
MPTELSQERIRKNAEAYYTVHVEGNDEIHGEESRMLRAYPERFADGSWRIERELENVFEWKLHSSRPWIGDRIVEENSRQELREAVDNAVTAESAGEAVDHLTRRSWIGPAVASTVLTFVDPSRYTVIDQRAIATLESTGYELDCGASPSVADYVDSYLPRCRELLEDYSVREIEPEDDVPALRVLDRALWMLGSD